MSEQRNFIIAAVLCLAVLLVWEMFVAKPQIEKQRQATPAQTIEQPGTSEATPSPVSEAPLPRAEALAESPRIRPGEAARSLWA